MERSPLGRDGLDDRRYDDHDDDSDFTGDELVVVGGVHWGRPYTGGVAPRKTVTRAVGAC